MTYFLDVATGLLLIPVAILAVAGWEKLRRGTWLELDDERCDACRRVPDDQWSPVHRCPRCGRRQVRAWLYRVAGRTVLDRWVGRGVRDEAWLRGETT